VDRASTQDQGGGGLSKEKHAIRKEINKQQLAELWKQNPILSIWMTKSHTLGEGA